VHLGYEKDHCFILKVIFSKENPAMLSKSRSIVLGCGASFVRAARPEAAKLRLCQGASRTGLRISPYRALSEFRGCSDFNISGVVRVQRSSC
jgi:hypothetical protein